MPWKHGPHDPITPVVDGVWQVQGTLPDGNPLPCTMMPWRLPTGGLCIHSAVNLEPSVLAELEALGPPEHLLVPKRFHRLHAQAWKTRYAALQVIAPKAARRFADQVLHTDADCEQVLPRPRGGVDAPGGRPQTPGVHLLGRPQTGLSPGERL